MSRRAVARDWSETVPRDPEASTIGARTSASFPSLIEPVDRSGGVVHRQEAPAGQPWVGLTRDQIVEGGADVGKFAQLWRPDAVLFAFTLQQTTRLFGPGADAVEPAGCSLVVLGYERGNSRDEAGLIADNRSVDSAEYGHQVCEWWAGNVRPLRRRIIRLPPTRRNSPGEVNDVRRAQQGPRREAPVDLRPRSDGERGGSR
jgi:hypothetical protein